MLRINLIIGLISCVFCASELSAQAPDSTGNYTISPKYLSTTANESQLLGKRLDKKSRQFMAAWQKQEKRLISKLNKVDSAAAKAIAQDSKAHEEQFRTALRQAPRQYISQLDTLATSLSFLQQHSQFIQKGSLINGKLDDAMKQVNGLQEKFKQAEVIKSMIRERKNMLQAQFEKLGLSKQLKKLNKQLYYYSAQVKAYKELLKDPKKAQKNAIALLSKTKLFRDFMKKNSMLASLFRIPGDVTDPSMLASLQGLQTRTQVNNLIQQQITIGGIAAQQQLSQNLQAAQSQLNELKNKILKKGGSGSGDDLPDFKPNNQKTKSFLQRLEFGTNIQSVRGNSFFPNSYDLAISVGYKLNDKSIVGVGTSYKLGLGRGWQHIRLSNEGIGIRSFVDIKLKKVFWISGGFEMNYQSSFHDFEILKEYSAWKKSGLLGISKTLSIKTKFFKKTSVKLLWDFLSYHQVPASQPLIFRIGYNF